MGLMQVMPASARMVGLNYSAHDLKCPERNIEAGVRILQFYKKRSKTREEALQKYSGNAKQYYNKVERQMRKPLPAA